MSDPDEPLDPAEFERRCEAVRQTWNERTERSRRAVKCGQVEVTEVKVKDLGEVE